MRSEVKNKARLQVSGHYGIPDISQSVITVQQSVIWLLSKSNFVFGGLQVKVSS